tara:strand:- start:284 stop:4993 length:4710 start_codon:yes stop_codon:yes gene_type:complete
MADITHSLYPGITVNTDNAVKDPGLPIWTYQANINGKTVSLPGMNISPEDMVSGHGDAASEAYSALSSSLRPFGKGTTSTEDRGILQETVNPGVQRGVANVFGTPVDLSNSVLTAVDHGINAVRYAAGGFEQFPRDRILSSNPKHVVGGSEQVSRGFGNVGELARTAIDATEEAGLNVNLGGGVVVGARTLFDLFSFNINPDESTKARKYVSLVSQIAGGAPLEGAALAKLVSQLAKTPGLNPTKKAIYDAMSEMQVNSPGQAAGLEALMGTAAGTGMVTSLEALDAAYPDAPKWMQDTVMAGGGILLPMVAATGGKIAYDASLAVPILRFPARVLQNAMSSLTPKGAVRAAARAGQADGGGWKGRSRILTVTDHLSFAISQGRDIDPATRIAMTTPQLASNEARILEAQIKSGEASGELSGDQLASQRDLLRGIRTFAEFQEGQLKTLAEGTDAGRRGGVGTAIDFYARYSERMLDRHESIFNALNQTVLKLDPGGLPSPARGGDGIRDSSPEAPAESPPQMTVESDWSRGGGAPGGFYLYKENRLRAIKEGVGTGMDADQVVPIRQAYDNVINKVEQAKQQALEDAQERADVIRSGMPENMDETTRNNYNRWIRSEFETAYREIDGIEDAFWKNIEGFDAPVKPKDGDVGPEITVDGVPISEHFAKIASELGAGGWDSQSVWLGRLAGTKALTEQAAAGKGPDAAKAQDQALTVQTQEGIVKQNEKALSVAQNRLQALQSQPYTNPKLVDKRARRDGLEAELASLPGQDTISQTTASLAKRIAEKREILDGLKAEIASLEKSFEGAANPELVQAQKAFERAASDLGKSENSLKEARGRMDLSLNRTIEYEGSQLNLADEVVSAGELSPRVVDGVKIGRTGQEISNVIKLLKREMSVLQGRGSEADNFKISNIASIVDDLQRAMADPANFDVDMQALQAATNVTSLKKDAFERGNVGRLRGFGAKREPKTTVEQTLNKVFAPGSKSAVARDRQASDLRQLEVALTPLSQGENTPIRVDMGLNGQKHFYLDTDHGLAKYAEGLPAPFERIDVGGGRSPGLKVLEGTQASPQNIEIVRNALWDRFKDFKNPESGVFDTSSASRWLEDNRAAVNWLGRSTGKPTGFEDLVKAEVVVNSISNARARNIDKAVEDINKAGGFNVDFTPEGFRTLVNDAARADSQIVSATQILGDPDPMTMGTRYLASFESSPKPADFLGQTLKVLENGALPDGSNPALAGFKHAVGVALVQKALTNGTGSGYAAQQAAKLSQDRRAGVTLWDPEGLVKIAGSERSRLLLRDLYGNGAVEVFNKIAIGAQDQFLYSQQARKGVRVQDRISDEWAGNAGRMIGGYISGMPFIPISSLVLTGVGRRYGINTLGEVRGGAVDKLIVDLLMNPQLWADAVKKFPIANASADLGPWNRLKVLSKKWAQHRFIDDNARRFERLGKTPGVLFEIGAEALDMREPDGPPPRRMGTVMKLNPPVPSSSLSQASGTGQAPAPTGQQPAAPPGPAGPPSPDVVQQGQQLFGANDSVFGPGFRHGGYVAGGAGSGAGRMEKSGIMSVPRKPRQLVG